MNSTSPELWVNGERVDKPAIDISEPITKLCELLGLDRDTVFRMEIEPTDASALVYLKRDGRKHVDRETGDAVMAYRTFKVRT